MGIIGSVIAFYAILAWFYQSDRLSRLVIMYDNGCEVHCTCMNIMGFNFDQFLNNNERRLIRFKLNVMCIQ